MGTNLQLEIVSPERRLIAGIEALSVTLPTSEGQIQLLPGHIPMMGRLSTGILWYESASIQSAQGHAVVSSGFFEVNGDRVTVLAETIELRDEIDFERAKIAQQKANQMLAEASLDEHQFKKYQLKLQRAILRQDLAKGLDA